ncbi:hypothetical protein CI789_19865 [Erwinia persicina]|nr:hypothetical protein CI789_19865 [Erwinia persicina]
MLIIPFTLHAAGALAAPVHPSHIVIYAPGDSQACRLPAARIILGINICCLFNGHFYFARSYPPTCKDLL